MRSSPTGSPTRVLLKLTFLRCCVYWKSPRMMKAMPWHVPVEDMMQTGTHVLEMVVVDLGPRVRIASVFEALDQLR